MSAPVGKGRRLEVSVVVVDYVSLFETHDWPTPAVAEGSAVRRKVETLFCLTHHAALVGEATPQREPRVALSLAAAARRRGTRTRGSNRHPKSQTGSNTNVLCEIISDVVLQNCAVHFFEM